jgi:hypothetical protein
LVPGPAPQLQVAMGIPLYNIPELSVFFGHDMYGTSKIDFTTEDYQPIENTHYRRPDHGRKSRQAHVRFDRTDPIPIDE